MVAFMSMHDTDSANARGGRSHGSLAVDLPVAQ